MKNKILLSLTVIVCLSLAVLGFVFSPGVTELQIKTLKVLGIVCACSALYCFVVGELSRNNSQMDKLWSILPIAYTWIIAGMGDFKARLVIIAILVTLWGIRLTFNFARKGAYSIKFWQGEEDYRWEVLRQNKILSNRLAWAGFDLGFISIYQNALVLAICLPALACMSSTRSLNYVDYVAMGLTLMFLIVEIIADEQQWKFHETKKKLLKEGKTLEELPEPYSKGFNTTGLWNYARHPNYLGEQMFWICIYLFTLGARVTTYYFFNWTLFGSMLLVLLFLGSSNFGESVSSKKYPLYQDYQKKINKYIPNPFKGYR